LEGNFIGYGSCPGVKALARIGEIATAAKPLAGLFKAARSFCSEESSVGAVAPTVVTGRHNAVFQSRGNNLAVLGAL